MTYSGQSTDPAATMRSAACESTAIHISGTIRTKRRARNARRLTAGARPGPSSETRVMTNPLMTKNRSMPRWPLPISPPGSRAPKYLSCAAVLSAWKTTTATAASPRRYWMPMISSRMRPAPLPCGSRASIARRRQSGGRRPSAEEKGVGVKRVATSAALGSRHAQLADDSSGAGRPAGAAAPAAARLPRGGRGAARDAAARLGGTGARGAGLCDGRAAAGGCPRSRCFPRSPARG